MGTFIKFGVTTKRKLGVVVYNTCQFTKILLLKISFKCKPVIIAFV